MINSEKGTIIISRYRSGGTQMRRILETYYQIKNKTVVDLGEFDINFQEDINSQINLFFDVENNSTKKIILLNNPLSISFLFQNNYFDKFLNYFNIFVLDRKNKEKSLLSIAVWEKLIEKNLYDYDKSDLEEKMIEFHEELIKNPIEYHRIHLGYHLEINVFDQYQYLNTIIRMFLSEISQIENIRQRYNLQKIYYEEYENDVVSFIQTKFKNIRETDLYLFKKTHKKIPYLSDDFKIYFDDMTQNILNLWNINN